MSRRAAATRRANARCVQHALAPHCFPRRIDVRDRIEEEIDYARRRVAQCRGAEERQGQVRPRAYAPDCERLTEVLVVGLQADRSRHVEQPGEPERAVEQEAAGVAQSQLGLALQELVDDRRRVFEVAQEIADADTHPARRDLLIALGDGLERGAVDGVVELVHVAVESFPTIVGKRAAGRGRATCGQHRNQYRSGGAQWAEHASRISEV
jgi:hypothetical protein